MVGIGRVGLPLALFLVDKGHTVYGIDVDSQKVNFILKGQMPFLEEGAETILRKNLNKSFLVSTDFANIAKTQTLSQEKQ